MSQNYASNADSVKDFVNNYTDEQIQGMEDMTSSANTQLSLKWRAEFDQAHAKALEEGTLAGESLGGLLGVKGLYKGATGGYKKLKDIYNKGKEMEKKAKELRDKLRGKKKKTGEDEDEDEEFDGFGDEDEDEEFDGFGDDLEDTDGKIPSNSKGDTGEEGDQDSSEKTPDFNDDDELTRGEDRQKGREDDDEDDFDDLGDDDFDPQGALGDLRKTLNEGDDAEGDAGARRCSASRASSRSASSARSSPHIWACLMLSRPTLPRANYSRRRRSIAASSSLHNISTSHIS